MALLCQLRELTIYGTAKLRAEFENKNAMALPGQVRDSWPSMAPLDHIKLTKPDFQRVELRRAEWKNGIEEINSYFDKYWTFSN